jgi:hypothetical protein
VLTRSAAPGEFRDLVAFTWTDGPWRRVIAIGPFGPFEHAVATLREIVSRRPTTPAAPELVPAGTADAVALVATPRWVRLLCGREFRRACPAKMPAPSSAFTLVQAESDRRGHGLDIDWGGPIGRPAADRPQVVRSIRVR